MTVSTELSHEEYTGNGVTTDFDFRFRIFEVKHLIVSVADTDGTERILTNGTDYTLRGVGAYRGGKVILKMPLAQSWKIGIARDLPAVQEIDLRNQGKFFAEVHEDAFDYLTMLVQKMLGFFSLCLRKPSFIADHYDAKGDKISNLGKPVKDGDAVNLGTMKEHIGAKDKRSLRVFDKDIPALPIAANRANKLLSFDNDGNPVLVVPESGSAADVLIELARSGGDKLVGSSFGDTIFSDYALSNYRRVTSGSFQDGGVIPDPFYGLLDKDSGLYWVYAGNFSAGGHLVTAGTVPDYPDYLCIGKMCADRFDSVINWGAKNNYNTAKGIGTDAVDAVNLASYHAGKRFEATGVRQSVFFPAGAYFLNKTTLMKGEDKGLTIYRNQEAMIFMQDGVSYIGEGKGNTWLHVASGIVVRNEDNGGAKGYVVFADGIREVKNVTISGLSIDLNGDGNLMLPMNWSGAQAHCPAIACYEGSDNVRVDNVDVYNAPGANVMIFQQGLNNQGESNNSFRTTIENCDIRRVSDAIPGNEKILDHSTIRIQSDGYLVRNVRVIQPSGTNSDISCAFECHGNGVVKDCHAEGMRYPFLKANDGGTGDSYTVFEGNTFEDAGSALVMDTIRDVKTHAVFKNNTGTLRAKKQRKGFFNSAAFTTQNPSLINAPQESLFVTLETSGNNITQKQRDSDWPDDQLVRNVTYDIDKILNLASIGNTFTGFWGGILLGQQKSGSAYYIDDTLISCGINGNPQQIDNACIRHNNKWSDNYLVHIQSFEVTHRMTGCQFGGYLALLQSAAGVTNGMELFTANVTSDTWMHPMLGIAPHPNQSYIFNMDIYSQPNTAAPLYGPAAASGMIRVHSKSVPHVKEFYKHYAYTQDGWWFRGMLPTDTASVPARPFGNASGDRYEVTAGANNIIGYIFNGGSSSWVPVKA